MQQMGQQQARRPGADDADLRLHGRAFSVPPNDARAILPSGPGARQGSRATARLEPRPGQTALERLFCGVGSDAMAGAMRQVALRRVQAGASVVLLADASGSIDDAEIHFQRQGYASAITHPAVLDAIPQGYEQRIAVTYVEWGGVARRRSWCPGRSSTARQRRGLRRGAADHAAARVRPQRDRQRHRGRPDADRGQPIEG